MIRTHAKQYYEGTDAERLALVPVDNVKVFFTTDTRSLYWWNGLEWIEFSASSFDTSALLPKSDFDDIQRYGFLDQAETSISFNDSTYVFTLGSVGATWNYWRNGVKYTITGSKTVTLPGTPPTAGVYFIYIDATDGTLTQSTTVWTLTDTKVPVALIIWNNTLTPKYHIGDERHTCLIDRRMHYYEHSTEGARYISGGSLSSYSLDTDTNAAHTFAVTACKIADEDIIHTNAALSDPDGNTAVYTLLYRTGASSWAWRLSDQPFPYTTTGYVEYDNAGTLTAGTGGSGANTRWINSYVVQTNLEGAAEIVIIPGQNVYSSLAAAQAENPATFTFTGLPISEFVIMWQLTWALRGGSSKGKCELDVDPKAVMLGAVTAASTISGGANHNALSNLQGGTVGEYYHLTVAQHTALGTGTGTPTFVGARAKRSTDQTISDSTWTAIQLDAEDYDSGNLHDTSTNNTRITVPTTGYYSFKANIQCDVNATGDRYIAFRVDGTLVAFSVAGYSRTSAYFIAIHTIDWYVTANQYVELYAYQNSGGNLAVKAAQLSVSLIGA